MATHNIWKPIDNLVKHPLCLLHAPASLPITDCTNRSFVEPISGLIQDTEMALTGCSPSILYPTAAKATLQSSTMQVHIQDIAEMDRSLTLISCEAVATTKCTLAQTTLPQDLQLDPRPKGNTWNWTQDLTLFEAKWDNTTAEPTGHISHRCWIV